MALDSGLALAATTLPRIIVFKPYYDMSAKGYIQYKVNEGNAGTGSVVMAEDESVFSTLVKIEAERATSDKFAESKYVHLRFTHSNKFWARGSGGRLVVAESTQAEEDTSKASCTLFEVGWVDGLDGALYLIHVQSGGRVRVDDQSKAVYVDEKAGAGDGYLSYVDWDKLPEHVAFRGDTSHLPLFF